MSFYLIPIKSIRFVQTIIPITQEGDTPERSLRIPVVSKGVIYAIASCPILPADERIQIIQVFPVLRIFCKTENFFQIVGRLIEAANHDRQRFYPRLFGKIPVQPVGNDVSQHRINCIHGILEGGVAELCSAGQCCRTVRGIVHCQQETALGTFGILFGSLAAAEPGGYPGKNRRRLHS